LDQKHWALVPYQPPSDVVLVDLGVGVTDEAAYGGGSGALVSGESGALPTSHSMRPLRTQGTQVGG
jgi:hypothetical protein